MYLVRRTVSDGVVEDEDPKGYIIISHRIDQHNSSVTPKVEYDWIIILFKDLVLFSIPACRTGDR